MIFTDQMALCHQIAARFFASTFNAWAEWLKVGDLLLYDHVLMQQHIVWQIVSLLEVTLYRLG
jgi:hypothetical protein